MFVLFLAYFSIFMAGCQLFLTEINQTFNKMLRLIVKIEINF